MIGGVLVKPFLRPEEVLSYKALCEASFHGSTPRTGGRSRVKRWGVWGWDHQPLEKVEPITDWLEILRMRVDAMMKRGDSDSISLNEFPPHGGVSPHVDSEVFEKEVAVVSLGDGVLRLFRKRPSDFRFRTEPGPFEEVAIASGSVYIMPQPIVHSFVVGAEARLSLVFRRSRQ